MEARNAVRAHISYDVDLIKVSLGHNVTATELTAVVDEAHRRQLWVAVHAIEAVIDGGADSIEHGNGMTNAQLKQFRDKGIFLDLTPTFYKAVDRTSRAIVMTSAI